MSKMKREDRDSGVGCEAGAKKKQKTSKNLNDEIAPPKTTDFKGYDLGNLPLEALPVYGREYKGNHSYTVYVEGAVS